MKSKNSRKETDSKIYRRSGSLSIMICMPLVSCVPGTRVNGCLGIISSKFNHRFFKLPKVICQCRLTCQIKIYFSPKQKNKLIYLLSSKYMIGSTWGTATRKALVIP